MGFFFVAGDMYFPSCVFLSVKRIPPLAHSIRVRRRKGLFEAVE